MNYDPKSDERMKAFIRRYKLPTIPVPPSPPEEDIEHEEPDPPWIRRYKEEKRRNAQEE